MCTTKNGIHIISSNVGIVKSSVVNGYKFLLYNIMHTYMYLYRIYIISTVAPTFVRASLRFSASSFAMSAFTIVGALSTNFLAYFYKIQND